MTALEAVGVVVILVMFMLPFALIFVVALIRGWCAIGKQAIDVVRGGDLPQ